MDSKLKAHWTERSINDFVFKIAADFAQQIENYLDKSGENRSEFAKKLNVTPGAVSQVLNNPGNLGLKKMVEYARAAGKKVAIVAYDDSDHENLRGLVNSQVFESCWIRCGRPSDAFALAEANQQRMRTFFISEGGVVPISAANVTTSTANTQTGSPAPRKTDGTDAHKRKYLSHYADANT